MKSGGVRRSRGMTLMELLLAATLLGLVGIAFGLLYSNAQRFFIQSANFTGSQTEAAYGLEHIKRRLLQAIAIANPTWPPPSGSTETSVVLSGTDTLQFTWQQNPPQPIVTASYSLQSGALMFQPAGGSAETVANNITSVTIRRTGSNVVVINITATQTSKSGDTRTMQLQTMVSPRGIV